MTTKLIEVRDKATTMVCLGISMSPFEEEGERDFKLLRRAGYGDRCILFGRAEGGHFHYDPYDHNSGARTIVHAHLHVIENWDKLKSGDIVDVEFILGESPQPKTTDIP